MGSFANGNAKKQFTHVCRWYNFLLSLKEFQSVSSKLPEVGTFCSRYNFVIGKVFT